MATGTADSIGGLGTGAQALGDLVKGFGEGRANDYQAQIARNNAEIARYNAQREMQAGEIDATALGMKTRAIVGQTKAAQAASGIDVNTGSAVAVQQSERALGMLDAMTIRSNAALKAYGYQSEAAEQTARAAMARQAGKFARIEGIMGASGTVLGGASSVAREKRIWQEQQTRHAELWHETTGRDYSDDEALWAGS